VTAYWDSLQRQIGAASERARSYEREHPGYDGDAQFLLEVNQIEARAVRAVNAVSTIETFPDDLRAKIARAIERATSKEALGYRMMTRSSELIGDLHSIFHDVATRKIQTPFGTLSDDPVGTLKRLDGNGKDAFEDHIDECVNCKALATLGTPGFCEAGAALEKQWCAFNDRMAAGVPPEEYPK
jgi:hypothetical protein